MRVNSNHTSKNLSSIFNPEAVDQPRSFHNSERLYANINKPQQTKWTQISSFNLPFLIFSLCTQKSAVSLSTPRTEEESMAATLSLLKLPILPPKPKQCLSKLQHSSIPKKPSIAKDSASTQKLITTTVHHLKSTSLPLTAATLPFLLDTKASTIQ